MELLRPTEIEQIQQQTPIAYIPWGALEYHGLHNPIGLDGIKSHGLCQLLAAEIGGIVLPPVYEAANLIKSYPGVNFKKHSIEFSEKLIRMMCEEYFTQLVETDYKIIVCLTGHAGEPHIDILKEVAKKYNKKYPSCYFWALAEFDIIPDDLLTANHSALGETSLQLVFAPETVDLSMLPAEGDITLIKNAVAGRDPRPSTAVFGQKIIDSFLKEAARHLRQIIQTNTGK